MGRAVGSKNKRKGDFEKVWDSCKRKYKTDPVDLLFRVAADEIEGEKVTLANKIDAAKALLPYRFARQVNNEHKGLENIQPAQVVMDFSNAGEFELPTEAATDSTAPTH